jgi:hypothetical protein
VKTLRTFKWKFLALPVIAAGAVALILRCAIPDEPPLRWLSKIEFPITNDSFNLAQKLPKMMEQFNDTIVTYWDSANRLPWISSTDLRSRNHARYFAAVDVSYSGTTWEKNHVYEWCLKDGAWKWKDLGEVIDILEGGTDSLHEGILYVPDTAPASGPTTMYPDMLHGDTVVMSIPRVDSISYIVSQDSMKTKSFFPTLGLLTVGSTDPGVREALKMKDTVVVPAGSVDSLCGITMIGVNSIAGDPSSPPCSVTVRNLSATSTVYNCRLVIFDSVRNFGDLAPLDSATRLFPMYKDSIFRRWGQGIGPVLAVRVQQDSASPQPDSIEVTVNLNGIIASEVDARSNYITFSKIFINPYELTDTLECHYIDILAGYFIYAINNQTDLGLEVEVSQLHLWDASWCSYHIPPIESVNDLPLYTVHADSFGMTSRYMGRGVKHLSANPYTTTLDSTATNVNLAACRLFPEWYYDSLETKPWKWKSVAPVEYLLYPRVEGLLGRMVDVKSTDQLVFTISAPTFKFRQMLATVRQRYERSGDMAKVEMPFPFSRESKQSLQANFRFKQVLNDLYFSAKLPDTGAGQFKQAFLDTLGISFTLFNPDNPSVTAGDTTQFLHVSNNKRYRVQTNITDIMNQWPDSLAITENIYVPVGTRVMAVNDLQDPNDPDYPKYMGRMNISAVTNVRTNMLFSWEVGNALLDTGAVKLDLGYGTFPVPDALKSFNHLENPLASISMKVFNHTNLYMNLVGLVAPEPLMNALRNMPSDTVRKLISVDTARARQLGYISLLGAKGIMIPGRNDTASSSVVLQKWQIDTMTKTGNDSCGWRWEATFLPMAADTLADTDYVFIQSWLHLEGVNNMDSLLIWNDK